eukprot:scaffold187793_cov55-Attheya_sp.AAC.5
MASCSPKEDDESSLADSVEEGFSLLLGGLTSNDLVAVEWDEDNDEGKKQVSPMPVGFPEYKSRRASANTHNNDTCNNHQTTDTVNADEAFRYCFHRAFRLNRNGGTVRPPVHIVDMSDKNNRGYALVASHLIRKGEVIFTERAVEAAQIPQACHVCTSKLKQNDWKVMDEDNMTFLGNKKRIYGVRGCQHCFRSMEPASSCCVHPNSHIEDDSVSSLPMDHLWPVSPYTLNDANYTLDERGHFVEKNVGYIFCPKCGASFCSDTCRGAHDQSLGSCCMYEAAIDTVVHSMHSGSNVDAELDEVDGELKIQSSIILATRMFCNALQRYRQNERQQPNHSEIDPYHGMCGDPSDVTLLEIGTFAQNSNTYSLQESYLELCNVFSMSDEERSILNLDCFHRLASIGARNGFEITTQSPFRQYHSSLLRTTGRDTEQHAIVMKQVANSLGSSDGELTRAMDRLVAERCAVEVVALFTLVARMNHSCDPCAEVRGHEFVDCHVDVVAKRDIAIGEEICISYINLGPSVGRSATLKHKRMKELKARYLFLCDCSRCHE